MDQDNRRRSGRLQHPPASPGETLGIQNDSEGLTAVDTTDEAVSYSESWDTESEDESDSGSEWGSPSKSKRTTSSTRGLKVNTITTTKIDQRPAKRRKVTGSTTPSQGKGSRIAGRLSLLPTMPLDILFESFGHLSPIELLALVRTNKPFRKTLLSRSSNIVWKTCRENVCGPRCSPGISEPHWANLLFGAAICEVCGTRGVQRIDFALRRRTCTACLKQNLVYGSRFHLTFPDFDPLILELIPYTHIGGWAHGHASSGKFYWNDDIFDMAKELGVYQSNVQLRKPGAKQSLENFKHERIKLVESILMYIGECTRWEYTKAARRENNQANKRDARYEAIKARFLQLGYLESDLSQLHRAPQVCVPQDLTERIWIRIRPILEPDVLAKKNRRLADERENIIREREAIVEELYTVYQKTLLPSQWRHLPRTFDICRFSAFRSIIDEPNKIRITEAHFEEAHFEEAMACLPAMIASWTDARRAEILKLCGPILKSENVEEGEVGQSADNSLGLAICVFDCTACETGYTNSQYLGCSNIPLISWSGAVAHGCMRRGGYCYGQLVPVETKLRFSERGSSAARSLIQCAQLDERSCVPDDMDKLDLRFFCSHCVPMEHRGRRYGRMTFSWRDAIAHFMSESKDSHPSPSWLQIDPQSTKQVKDSEGADPSITLHAWTCAHCTIHLDDLQDRETVIDHVKHFHNIDSPSDTADFFLHVSSEPVKTSMIIPRTFSFLKMARPQTGNLTPDKIYVCKQCPLISNKKPRLFALQGVREHLKAKHKVASPIAGQDWVLEKDCY